MHGGGGKKMGLVGASSLVVTNMVGTGLVPAAVEPGHDRQHFDLRLGRLGDRRHGARPGLRTPGHGRSKSGRAVRVCARPHGAVCRLPDQHAVLGGQRHRQRRHRGVGHRLPGRVLPGARQPLAVQCLHGAGDLDLHLAQHARCEHRGSLHHVHHGRGDHPDRGGRPARLALVQPRHLHAGLESRATPTRRGDHQQRIHRVVGVPRRRERRRFRRASSRIRAATSRSPR